MAPPELASGEPLILHYTSCYSTFLQFSIVGWRPAQRQAANQQWKIANRDYFE
jgi:hypothetical protein